MELPKKVLDIIHYLEKGGFTAFAVGGCVRDSLMGIAPHDYDIATNALPEQSLEIFAEFRTIPTGLKHGTITVMSEDEPIEITTYRDDGEYFDHRRPQSVKFSTTIESDLSRRDFTINAIAFNPRTGYIDLYGGQEDINNKIIRCVGNASKRFNEDALRILRGVRFASQMGFNIEEQTGKAMLENRSLLTYVSSERQAIELIKILCTENFIPILRKYRDILSQIVPEVASTFDFNQFSKYHHLDVYEHILHSVKSIKPLPHLRLTMLFHDIGKPFVYTNDGGVGHFYGHEKMSCEIASRTFKRLKFDNKTINDTLFLIKYHDLPLKEEDAFVKRWLNRAGSELFFDLIDVHIADDSAKHKDYRGRIAKYERIRKRAEEIIAQNECFSLKNLAINGHDLLDLGFEGKIVGQILNFLLGEVIAERCENDKSKLLSLIKIKFCNLL